MSRHYSLRVKLTLLLTAAILSTALAVGWLCLRSAQHTLKDRLLHDLAAITTISARDIHSAVQEDYNRVALIAAKTQLRDYLARIEAGDPRTKELAARMNRDLADAYRSVQAIRQVCVVDNRGKVVASSHDALIGTSMAGAPVFEEGKKAVFMAAPAVQDGKWVYDFGSPMTHPDQGGFIGVLLLRLELVKIEELLSNPVGMGATGELILGRRQGDVFLTIGPVRLAAETAQSPDGDWYVRFEDLHDGDDIGVGDDYRGVEVLAARRDLPVPGWELVAKVDAREAFHPLAVLQETAAAAVLAVATLGILGALLISEPMTRRIQALRVGVTQIAQGKLDHRVDVKGHDELGELSAAFNQMAGRLRAQTGEIRRTQEETIHRLVAASMYRDEETGAHIRRTGLVSEMLARAAGWSAAEAEGLRMAAPMHDVGKIGIPDRILCKPGRLTAEEFEVMKTHTTIGAAILAESKVPMLQLARTIALNHHERWDGAGYPNGLSGDAIPESARIVALVDVYDALTHDRVYRPALPAGEVLEIMQQGMGRHFDPILLTLFLSLLPEIDRVTEEVPDDGTRPDPACYSLALAAPREATLERAMQSY